jgi:hypothetical protein
VRRKAGYKWLHSTSTVGKNVRGVENMVADFDKDFISFNRISRGLFNFQVSFWFMNPCCNVA